MMWERIESRSQPGKFYWRCGQRSQWKRPAASILVPTSIRLKLDFPVDVLKLVLLCTDAVTCARFCASSRACFTAGSDDCIWRHRVKCKSRQRGAALREFGVNVCARIGLEMRADQQGRDMYYAQADVSHIQDPFCRDLVSCGVLQPAKVQPGTASPYTSHAVLHHAVVFQGCTAHHIKILDNLGPKGLRFDDLNDFDTQTLLFAAKYATALDNRNKILIALRLPALVKQQIIKMPNIRSRLRLFVSLPPSQRAKYQADLRDRTITEKVRSKQIFRFQV